MSDEDLYPIEDLDGDPRAADASGSLRVALEVEEALGPGLDIAVDHGLALAAGARRGTLWLGLDRAHVADSDAGDGASMAALLALPASSFEGCRVDAELLGALEDGGRTVLVARYADSPVPPEALLRTVARVGASARWVDASDAHRLVREARARYRARRGASRIVGGRAWQPAEGLDPGARRFTTPHSQAEYRLDRLPPRFLRGLEGLLDDDERILYAIERPPAGAGLLERARGTRDLRAALLLLTDRQLLWLVDHVAPNRYLLDWGVDARLVALEALRAVELGRGARGAAELQVATSGGPSRFVLPAELRPEAQVMADLLRRFAEPVSAGVPRRRYEVEPIGFEAETAARFGQAEEAGTLLGALEGLLHPEPVLGRFYAPRREHVPEAAAVVFSASRAVVARSAASRGAPADVRPSAVVEVALSALGTISLSLSPLVCRLELEGREPPGRRAPRAAFTYPAPLVGHATPIIRLLRRAWANALPIGAAGRPAPVAESGRALEVATVAES